MTRNDSTRSAKNAHQRAGRWPDFLLIGAMKAGTTLLHGYLAKHPGIFMCEPKEPQFFSRNEIFDRGDHWYRDLFCSASREQLCGEASTCYSRWPHHGDVPERIAQVLPDARLIYIMRHPVERCYSHYGHRMQERGRRGMDILPFDEYLRSDPEVIDASLYMQQIERYLQHYSCEQLLCLIFEEFVVDPKSTMNTVFKFLDLPAMKQPLAEAEPVNARGNKMARSCARKIMRNIHQAWGVRELANCLPASARQGIRSRCESLLTGSMFGSMIQNRFKRSLSPMTDGMRAALFQRFEKPTRDLERFLGRTLDHWRA